MSLGVEGPQKARVGRVKPEKVLSLRGENVVCRTRPRSDVNQSGDLRGSRSWLLGQTMRSRPES